MVNLTSFTLSCTPPGAVSVVQLLDFFESATYLEEVGLYFVAPTTGAQNGRLVSLACLKSMCIEDDNPASVLLDHLLIPVGAKLEIEVDLVNFVIGEHLPTSINNLKNLSDFTIIRLHPGKFYPRMKFSGPNGQVNIILRIPRGDTTDLTLGALAEFDTSKTKQLEIYADYPPTVNRLYQALLPMRDLRTLTLSGCARPEIFIRALQPANTSSEVVVCPKLEELVFVLHREWISYITVIIEMVAARASRGEKLGTLRIVGERDTANVDVSELKKHVWNVKYCSKV